MSFIVGSGSICQINPETTWGTASSTTTNVALVNMTSESINTTINKGDEGNLLATQVATNRDTLSVDVAGDVSSVLRPGFAGLLIGTAFGKESSTAADLSAGTHKLVLAQPGDSLPSLTVYVDRGKTAAGSTTNVSQYKGMTISSLTLDAAPNDYVKCTASFMGKDVSSTNALIAPALKTFTQNSYKCTDASFKYGTTAANTTICASNVSIKLDNKLEEAPRTYCTKLYKGRPMPATREVTVSFEMPYNMAAQAIETAYYDPSNEDGVTINNLTLDFNNGHKTGGVYDYTVKIEMPVVAITGCNHSIGGAGAVTAKFDGIVLQPSTSNTEPITATIKDGTTHAWVTATSDPS